METTMDESLRVAYLEAMGIPVWLPRKSRQQPGILEAPEAVVAEDKSVSPIAALRGSVASRVEPDAGRQRRSRQGLGGDKITAGRLDWVLVRAGSCLLIDELPETGNRSMLGQFHAALARAFSVRGVAARIESFHWPPVTAAPLDRAQLSDAVAGRLEAIVHEGGLAKLIVLGDGASAMLEQACSALMADCEVSHHPRGADLVASVSAKRELWRAMTAGRSGGDT